MENTIGQMIGKIKHSMSVTNDNKEKTSIMVTFDFSTATDVDIKSWLCGSRAIAFQRPARSLSKGEIDALSGTVVIAQNAGVKVKSRDEIERDALAAMSSMDKEQQTAFLQKMADSMKTE